MPHACTRPPLCFLLVAKQFKQSVVSSLDVIIVVHGDTIVGSVLHVILTVDEEEAAPDDEEDVRWYKMVADEWQEVAGGMSYTVSQGDAGCALRAAYYEVGCVITSAVVRE